MASHTLRQIGSIAGHSRSVALLAGIGTVCRVQAGTCAGRTNQWIAHRASVLQRAVHVDRNRSSPRHTATIVAATSGNRMKALVYEGDGKKALEERPIPEIQHPTDAIVKLSKTTICGTDLHILKGHVPTVTPGRILGHEGIGVVEKIGSAVSEFDVGNTVLISCITSCGKCEYCKRGMYSHCTKGGWVLGNTIDGCQAEYVRIPLADTSLYHLPHGMDHNAAVMLSDVLPTAFEAGVINGGVAPGSIVAIVGAGPIGIAALLTAQLYSPAQIIMVDVDEARLEAAKKLGATAGVRGSSDKDVVAKLVLELTHHKGVDTAIEAVGIPATFHLCQEIIAPGGTIANIGVHGSKVDLDLHKLWDRNITIRTRLVDTVSTSTLMKQVCSCKLDPLPLATHHFHLSAIMQAYDTFARAAQTHALKVIIDV